MVAVAGAAAEHVLDGIAAVPGLAMAHVNHGGDIAVHLAGQGTLRVGLVGRPATGAADGLAVIRGGDAVRGLATSGWRGRSLIAEAVDADHPRIRRAPAQSLDPDSDLRDLPVTVEVGALPPAIVRFALDRGEAFAQGLLARGLALGVCLRLRGQVRLLGASDAQVNMGREPAAW